MIGFLTGLTPAYDDDGDEDDEDDKDADTRLLRSMMLVIKMMRKIQLEIIMVAMLTQLL